MHAKPCPTSKAGVNLSGAILHDADLSESYLFRTDLTFNLVQKSGAAQTYRRHPKKQYNLGAAHLNKGVALQDSLVSLRDPLTEKEKPPTDEERKKVKELDRQRRVRFKKAIPPLERARDLSGRGGEYYENACRTLFQAYVQTDQQRKAEQLREHVDGNWDSREAKDRKTGGN